MDLVGTRCWKSIIRNRPLSLPLICCVDDQAIHDPIETDDSWINGRSCESISAEDSSDSANDDTDWDNRRIACGMVAQVNKPTGLPVVHAAVRMTTVFLTSRQIEILIPSVLYLCVHAFVTRCF